MTTIANTRQINVRFAEVDNLAAIARFNARLRKGGRREQLPLAPELPGESHAGVQDVYRRLLIAEDGEEVRAGLLLLHHTLWVQGEGRRFCWVQLPLSEGLVDRRFSLAIVQLVRSALVYEPFLAVLGVGSLEEDWSRFMLKMGWKSAAVPFLFCPLRVTRFLHGLGFFNSRPHLRWGAALAARCGLGHGISGYVRLRRRWARSSADGQYSEECTFGSWADQVFQDARDTYGAVAQRDAATLNLLYPTDDRRYIRLRVRHPITRRELGWIVVIHSQMRGDRYFGDLHVGTLVDGFGNPADIPAIVHAGLRHLEAIGVDLVVANWSHVAWIEASRNIGFFTGPTNFYFFTAPAGAPLLNEECPLTHIHLTRGDCDGPANLLGRK